MSLQDIAISIRCLNHASHEFERISLDSQSMAAQVKSAGAAMAGLGATGLMIGHLANQFGILNDQQARAFNSAMSVVMVFGMLLRSGYAAAIAQHVYSAACAFATAVQNALNISYATFLALTGVGIAVIIAAAAAMWSFANSMNAATSSVQSFNSAASETPSHGRNIQRSGELDMARRGL